MHTMIKYGQLKIGSKKSSLVEGMDKLFSGKILLKRFVTKTFHLHWSINFMSLFQVIAEERQKSEDQIKADQKLQNYIVQGNLLKALRLCIKLNRPRLARKTLEALQKRNQLESALEALNMDDRNSLFNMVVQWNSVGSFCALAQEVLKHLLKVIFILPINRSQWWHVDLGVGGSQITFCD